MNVVLSDPVVIVALLSQALFLLSVSEAHRILGISLHFGVAIKLGVVTIP